MKRPSRRSDQPLVLAETLDLVAATPLATALLAKRGQDIAIDASAVRRLGGQCLQVLLAARAAWLADGRFFRITVVSAEFAHGLTQFGAADLAPPIEA
jgi:chemotaxis protein CheX